MRYRIRAPFYSPGATFFDWRSQYTVCILLGSFCGYEYGRYVRQFNWSFSTGFWEVVVLVALGGFVGLVVGITSRRHWSDRLKSSLSGLARGSRAILRSRKTQVGGITICIALGAFHASSLYKARQISQLTKRNLIVDFNYPHSQHPMDSAPAPAPTWLRYVLGVENFRNVKWVRRREKNVDIRDADMVHLAVFSHLESLELYNNQITSEGLRQIARLDRLLMLDLRDNLITDDGLTHLSKMVNLESLNLSENRLTDRGLRRIGHLHELQTLDLSDNDLSGDGLTHLDKLSNLQSLSLSENNIAGDKLKHLQRLSQLRHLGIDHNPLTGHAIEHLLGLPNLRSLSLHLSEVTDADIAHIARFPKLRNLVLMRTNASDECVRFLSEAKSLEILDVTDTHITELGIAQLRIALPNCRIHSGASDDPVW